MIVKLAELSNTKSHFRDYESKERVEGTLMYIQCTCEDSIYVHDSLRLSLWP